MCYQSKLLEIWLRNLLCDCERRGASPGCWLGFLRRVEGIDLQIPAEERSRRRRRRPWRGGATTATAAAAKWGNKVKRRSIERTRERPTVSRSQLLRFFLDRQKGVRQRGSGDGWGVGRSRQRKRRARSWNACR